jgi:hypothetical protein
VFMILNFEVCSPTACSREARSGLMVASVKNILGATTEVGYHKAGLKRIISLRGGFENFEFDSVLQNLFCA